MCNTERTYRFTMFWTSKTKTHKITNNKLILDGPGQHTPTSTCIGSVKVTYAPTHVCGCRPIEYVIPLPLKWDAPCNPNK